MDVVSILLILIVIAAVAGVAVFAAVQTGLWSSWALPTWGSARPRKPDRLPGRVRTVTPDERVSDHSDNGVAVTDAPGTGLADAIAAPLPPDDGSGSWREEPRTALATLESWFGSLQRELDERSETIVRGLGEIAREAALERDRTAALLAGAQSRQEEALERLRGEFLAARAQAPVDGWLDERRAEMVAELYLRLARLEAAIAAVTNPILLPGEPYTPPGEFMAEALTWDNWKDVGERAFAFADTFSSRRLYLSEGTSRTVADFVTKLRGLLTRSIYPNLRPEPSPAQLQALRAALEEVAAELPRLRADLETEFRAATKQRDGANPAE